MAIIRYKRFVILALFKNINTLITPIPIHHCTQYYMLFLCVDYSDDLMTVEAIYGKFAYHTSGNFHST